MITSTVSMTMPHSPSTPSAWKHSSMRNSTGRRPGKNTPSRVGYSALSFLVPVGQENEINEDIRNGIFKT